RMVVHAFGRERIMAVTLDLVAQGADHLRVAEIAAFADVDIALGEFERGIRPDAIARLDRAFQIEQRLDFHEAADRDHGEDAYDQDDRVALQDLVPAPERHLAAPYSFGCGASGA